MLKTCYKKTIIFLPEISFLELRNLKTDRNLKCLNLNNLNRFDLIAFCVN